MQHQGVRRCAPVDLTEIEFAFGDAQGCAADRFGGGVTDARDVGA